MWWMIVDGVDEIRNEVGHLKLVLQAEYRVTRKVIRKPVMASHLTTTYGVRHFEGRSDAGKCGWWNKGLVIK